MAIDFVARGMANTALDTAEKIQAIGRFLSTWNCVTGKPKTDPTTLPYTYKTGDYYIVGNVATDGYVHTVTLEGTTSDEGIYQGTYAITFSFKNQTATAYTTISDIATALGSSAQYTASGTFNITGGSSVAIDHVLQWTDSSSNKVIALVHDEEKYALTGTTATTLVDTVSGGLGTTNYKPNGSTYTGTASTSVESGTVVLLDMYYYDGTNWVLLSIGTTLSQYYIKPDTGIPESDLATAVQNAITLANSAYQKPANGIPATDLASAVQASLSKADSAYQKPATGISKTDFAESVQDSLDKADDDYGRTDIDEMLISVLNTDNYKEVMKAWFIANGCNAVSDLRNLCNRWYDITRTGWTGGTTFAKPDASSLSTGTKIGDNAGLSCSPSTNSTAGTDDYAGLPLFAPVDCNAYLDDNGKLHISAIDGISSGFSRTDTSKIVAVMQMTPWIKRTEDSTSFTWMYSDQKDLDGYVPWPDAIELDGTVRNFRCQVKYNFGDNYTACSGQKPLIWSVSHNDQLTGVRSAWGNRYCGYSMSDLAWIKMMFYIKYASLTGDNIMAGCFSYSNHPNIAVAETNVERVIIAKSNIFLVGSTVCVGGDYGSKATQCSVVDRAKISSIETVTIDGTKYTALNLDNGGTKFTTSTDNYVTTMQWYSGSTDDVLGNDGSPFNNSSVKEPYKIQGIEMMVGCYVITGDTILKHVDVNGSIYQKAFVCRDATKLSTSSTSDYQECSFGFPCQASSSWVYIASNGYDSDLIECIFPDAVGGSSSTLTRDQYYIETASVGTLREALLFCRLDYGLANGGVSTVHGGSGLGYSNWFIGGCVSLNGNRGELTS